LIDSCECEIRTETISTTIAKMLSAQRTITAAKAPSAIRPELLACRKLRMADGVTGAIADGEPISVCGTIVLIIGGEAILCGIEECSSGGEDNGIISGSFMGCSRLPYHFIKGI
jgi:hypothetical protein